MLCPVCRHEDSKVLDTRTTGDGIRRRRVCLACGHRFTTHERTEVKLPLVVKKDGRRAAFDLDKVTDGLRLACRKRPVSAEDIDAAAGRVEQALVATGQGEVESALIGSLVLAELQNLDLVAYLRFASVYLEIQSPRQFLQLLEPWLPPARGGLEGGLLDPLTLEAEGRDPSAADGGEE